MVLWPYTYGGAEAARSRLSPAARREIGLAIVATGANYTFGCGFLVLDSVGIREVGVGREVRMRGQVAVCGGAANQLEQLLKQCVLAKYV